MLPNNSESMNYLSNNASSLNQVEVTTKAEAQVLKKLLQQLTAQLPGMVFQLRLRSDGSICFPYVSEGIYDLMQLAPEDVCRDASLLFSLVHRDDLAALQNSIEKSAMAGQPWRQRFRIQFDHAPLRWLQGNATPQREPDGSCLWHGFLADVSAEVAAKEQLRLAASIFANSQEGITITDAGGYIADVNPAFTRITGYRRDEVLGRSSKMLSSGHQNAAFYARMWDSLRNTGAWRGEIWNRNKTGEVYPELLSIAAIKDDHDQISHYIGSFSDITHLKQHEVQLDRLAHYDPLTSLPNLRLLGDRLCQAITHTRHTGKMMAIGMLDLDHFKLLNARYGYAAGDQVLVEIARRLRTCVHDNDTVARIGSDKFVLLLQDMEWVEECDKVLTRLLHEVIQPIVLGQTSDVGAAPPNLVHISASIGLALFPQDAANADTLLRHADQALYLAKQAGRNRYQLFDIAHDRLVHEHRRLIEDLAIALTKNQFVLHYQPKVDMATGHTVGVEALLRWRHPERGLLVSAEFLYAVAHSDIEIPLGDWVLKTALQQAALWQSEDLHLPISINLGLRHLLQPDFPAQLAAALATHPELAATSIELEILESSALADLVHSTVAIKACQALGVRVALDDFGSGYASLAYFKNLPVQILKIDQAFIRDMTEDAEDLAIVEGVIKIATAFGRDVIAEGVETVEQGILLLHLGCRFAQGFAIARPMSAESLQHWLAHWSGEPAWQDIARPPL